VYQPTVYQQPAAQQQVGYPPQSPTQYPVSAQKVEDLAIAGLVCGITGLVTLIAWGLGVILGILGVVFGIIAIRRVDASGGALKGRGMALAGAICGGVAIALSFLWLVIILVSASSSSLY